MKFLYHKNVDHRICAYNGYPGIKSPSVLQITMPLELLNDAAELRPASQAHAVLWPPANATSPTLNRTLQYVALTRCELLDRPVFLVEGQALHPARRNHSRTNLAG